MKNAFGGLLRENRHWAHTDIHATLVDLLAIQKEIHPGLFAVMDGTICGDGAGPRAMTPVIKDYMLASDDMVAIDAVSAWLMGFDPLADVDFIRIAHERGLGRGRRARDRGGGGGRLRGQLPLPRALPLREPGRAAALVHAARADPVAVLQDAARARVHLGLVPLPRPLLVAGPRPAGAWPRSRRRPGGSSSRPTSEPGRRAGAGVARVGARAARARGARRRAAALAWRSTAGPRCRVEAIPGGVEIESKESLREGGRARRRRGSLERSPGSLAAQALDVLGARHGLRVVTRVEGAGGLGDPRRRGARARATAAVAGALGRGAEPDGARRALAREAARAGRAAADDHGLHAALFGGVVLTRGAGGRSRPSASASIPARDRRVAAAWSTGERPRPAAPPGPDAAARERGLARRTDRRGALAAAATRTSWSLRRQSEPGAGGRCGAGAAPRRRTSCARRAGPPGSAGRQGRLLAVWAPPGRARARAGARRSRPRCQAAGLKPLAVRRRPAGARAATEARPG